MFDSLMERFESLKGKKLRAIQLAYAAGMNDTPYEVILSFEGGDCVRFTAPADVDFGHSFEKEET